MKTTTKLAVSSLKAGKTRSILTGIAIFLTTALITVIAFGCSTMIRQQKATAAEFYGEHFGTFNLEEVLKRGFDTILLGYGNAFLANKFVKKEKEYLRKLLHSYKDKVVDIVEGLTVIHPLMAGRYFPNRWKLRPFVFEKEEPKEFIISFALRS